MSGIDSSVIVHRLNVSPSSSPIRQKKRVFAQERDKAITEEVRKLLEAIHSRSILPKLVGKHGYGQKGQWKVQDVRRLHGPQ